MSTAATVAFAKRLSTDEQFQAKAAAAVEGKTGPEAAEALIELGSSEGLEVTREELGAIDKALSAVDDLSDDQLEGVAGGTTLQSIEGTALPAVPKIESDDQQLADIDLQNALQQQQQAMQMTSSILKSYHDTAKAIIQNVRA